MLRLGYSMAIIKSFITRVIPIFASICIAKEIVNDILKISKAIPNLIVGVIFCVILTLIFRYVIKLSIKNNPLYKW